MLTTEHRLPRPTARCKMARSPSNPCECAVAQLPVIFDCDPGKDDAFALLLALAVPDALDVTAVAGNVPLRHAARNARRIVDASGRGDVPVYAGCSRPILHELFTAEETHGLDGLGGSGLPESMHAVEDDHAITALI